MDLTWALIDNEIPKSLKMKCDMNLFKPFLEKIILIIFILTFSVESESKMLVFKKNHCVAWKTKKRMFLTRFLEPIGINCSLKTQFKRDDSGYYIEVEVPIKGFDSKEPKRDKEILKILRSDLQPILIIRTKSYSLEQWKHDWSSNKFQNKIIIKVANKKIPLLTYVKKIEEKNQMVIKGKVLTKFSNLSLSPPSLAWGIITEVSDYLELHYTLNVSKIKGFEIVTNKP